MPEFILNANYRGSHPYYSLSTFAKGYVEAAFFTNVDCGDSERENHANELGVERLTHKAVDAIARDCAAFLATPIGTKGKTVAAAIDLAERSTGYDESQAGRDFWFTRQGHGVGYWSRESDVLRAPLAEILSKAARTFGEAATDIYRGWIRFYSNRPAIPAPTPARFLYRRGDGNEGNYPRLIVELKPKDSAFAALAALVANDYIAGRKVRRHIIRNLEIDGETEYGIHGTVYEGPAGETAFGAAYITAELTPLSPEDFDYWTDSRIQVYPIRRILDNGALIQFRRSNR